jgi:hypothetical protein
MIKEFGKKGFKEIKKLMKKLEIKKETLDRQEDLLIQEKERNYPLTCLWLMTLTRGC